MIWYVATHLICAVLVVRLLVRKKETLTLSELALAICGGPIFLLASLAVIADSIVIYRGKK